MLGQGDEVLVVEGIALVGDEGDLCSSVEEGRRLGTVFSSLFVLTIRFVAGSMGELMSGLKMTVFPLRSKAEIGFILRRGPSMLSSSRFA